MDIHAELIDTYPDFSELVAEAVSEPYPVQGERRVKQHKSNISALRDAVVEGDDAEAGRILRIMICAQLDDWGGVSAYQAEKAEYLMESER
jgi:hypothetical protein